MTKNIVKYRITAMEEVKINYFGFTEDFDQQNNFLLNALAKNFKPVISDKPDFVFVRGFIAENIRKNFLLKTVLKSSSPRNL